METSKLAERLRSIITTRETRPATLPGLPGQPDPRAPPDLASALDGTWFNHSGGSTFVIERRWHAGAKYGRVRIGDMAGELEAAS